VFAEDLSEERMNGAKVLTADVFPEVPGDEIIATTRHFEQYPQVLRVHSNDGILLFQTWHPGWFIDMHWDERDARLLILSSANRLGSEDLGLARGTLGSNPHSLFTLRPVNGVISDQWIGTPGSGAEVTAERYSVVYLPALDVLKHGWLQPGSDETGVLAHIRFRESVAPSARSEIWAAIDRDLNLISTSFSDSARDEFDDDLSRLVWTYRSVDRVNYADRVPRDEVPKEALPYHQRERLSE
jgi:hypothetical protein